MRDNGVNVLVTGGTGFIGSAVVENLARAPGASVALLSRGGGLARLVARGVPLGPGGVRVLHGDFTGPELPALLSQSRPDTLIHLAMAYHPIGTHGGDEVERVNHLGSVRLAREFFSAGGRRFVMAGTCFEYGHQGAARVGEEAPVRPAYPYAAAKARATEGILALAAATGNEAVVLRVFAPYGPLEQPGRIVPLLMSAAGTGRRLELSPGEQVRDYVYVDDVAGAFAAAALAGTLPAPRAVYNVCTGEGHSLRQLAEEVQRATGRALDLAWGAVPYRPGEMMRLVGCPERAATELGWRASRSLREGLAALARHSLPQTSAA